MAGSVQQLILGLQRRIALATALERHGANADIGRLNLGELLTPEDGQHGQPRAIAAAAGHAALPEDCGCWKPW